MTETDDRIRGLLHGLAEEAEPAPLLARLDREVPPLRRRRRLVAAATAAAVAAAALVTVAVSGRYQQTAEPLPSERPPKVFRLTDRSSLSPGLATMAVTLAGKDAITKPVYLHLAKGGPAVHLSASYAEVWSERLSADGKRLLRLNDDFQEPVLEVVNLITGRIDDLGGHRGRAVLSGDNDTVAQYSYRDHRLRLVDVRTRSSRVIRRVVIPPTAASDGLAWAPDSMTLWVRDREGSVLLDRQGRVQLRVSGAYVPNGSTSWSPDGRSTIMYADLQGQFVTVPKDGGPPAVLHRPPGGIKPLGWAGSRVVWLVGEPGSQRLVTTDQQGRDQRTWMRFDVGDQVVDSVSWSRALSG